MKCVVKHTMNKKHINSYITLFGVFGFISVVVYLHIVQVDYSPLHQLMSELALGKNGSIMILAFLFFALSVVGSLNILASYKAHYIIKIILGLAALSLAGAGVFKLGEATTLHVFLVALAFILLVLCMYLTPRLIADFKRLVPMVVCWGLGTFTAVFVGMGHGVLPIGLAQRLAAMCLLLWLCWLAIFKISNEGAQSA